MTSAVALGRLQQLPGFKACGKDQYEAKCPCHEDHRASLSIGIGNDGRILLKCHAGCETDHILKSIGVEAKDLFPASGNGTGHRIPDVAKSRIVAAYDYVTTEGKLSYQVVRLEPKDFRQRRPDGKGGWNWSVKGLKPIPYNLPEFLQAEYVFIVEGEKDVENIRKLGLIATCNSGGAGNWTAELNQYFRSDQHITIIPDNDEPGAKHAQKVAENLYGKVVSINVLELTGLSEKGDVSDWLQGRDPVTAAEELCRLSEAAPEWKPEEISQPKQMPHQFEQITEERYRLTIADLALTLEVDRLRRDHHELIGELTVRCTLPGVPTYDGAVSIADFNLSSARARTERAKLLSGRSNVKELDWPGYLEELCQRVLAAERAGQPAIDLRQLDKPDTDDILWVDGIRLPRRHPAIVFGDGGSAKSYTGLYWAGSLAQKGLSVALFDWELAGEDHRDRHERLFGKSMPKILYARCERPLVYETDRLRRIIRDEKVDYAIFDSIAFACDGPPESAEIASRYFRALRQIGVGSLHIAHITKSEGGDQKPFGSVFWHNGARSTWFIKLADESPDGQVINIGLFNKKSNLGRLQSPIGYRINFDGDRTVFERTNPADSPDLAKRMPIRERLRHQLKQGAMSVDEVAGKLGIKPNSIYKAIQRFPKIFILLDGGKVALCSSLQDNYRANGQPIH